VAKYTWQTGPRARGFAWISSIVILWASAGGQVSSGQALTPPTASVQKGDVPAASLFIQDLEILSQRLKITFIAESWPLSGKKESLVPSLNERLSQEDAVKEVADYFDYDVIPHGHVYLLQKRYTAPEDVPEVTSEECLMGLKAVSTILAPFNPKIPTGTISGDPMANIANLLDKNQLNRLGEDGIRVADLTPPQHEEVWRVARKFFLQTEADRIDNSYISLENENPTDPVFHWEKVLDVTAFGYDTRSVKLNKSVFIPVSNSNRIMVTPDGGTGRFTNVRKHNGVVVPDLDPTDPLGVSENAKQFLGLARKQLKGPSHDPAQEITQQREEDVVVRAGYNLANTDVASPAIAVRSKPVAFHGNSEDSATTSIAQAIAALNGDTPAPVCKVDPMYAAKRVTIVGLDNLQTDRADRAGRLLRSLAELYGLRVAQGEDGSLTLTHRLFVEPQKLSDLSAALKSAIPDPIYRALHKHSRPTDNETTGRGNPVLSYEYTKSASACQHSAMQMFRYLAEAAVSSKPEKRLALSQIGETARSLFIVARTVDAFSSACWLAGRAAPPYITDFDHVTLTGGIYHNEEGAERLSLFFSYPNATTHQMYRGVGFVNAIVPR